MDEIKSAFNSSEEESDMYDLPDYIIPPIDPEDINAIRDIPSAEEMKKFSIVGFRKIYEGCKNPYLVQNFGYTLDDIPEKLLEQFRNQDEEDNALGGTEPESQEDESEVSVSKQHDDNRPENLNNENVELIKLSDNIQELTKQTESAQSSFQDCYGFNGKFCEKSNDQSFKNHDRHALPQNFHNLQINSETIKPKPTFSIDKNDANYLNQKFRRIPNMICANNFNFSSIKFNQQMPRHEFYNQQRNLINQMEKIDLNNFQNGKKMQNIFESSSTSLVDSFYQMNKHPNNQFLINGPNNCTQSLCGSANGQFYRNF